MTALGESIHTYYKNLGGFMPSAITNGRVFSISSLPSMASTLIIGLTAFGLLVAAAAAPIGNSLIGYPSGEKFYQFLEPICHQFPTLSFWLFEHPMALCARCTGGYLGVMLGAILMSKLAPRYGLLPVYAGGLTVLFLAVLEALIHPTDDNVWRMTSGLLGGGGAVLAFIALVQGTERRVHGILSNLNIFNQKGV